MLVVGKFHCSKAFKSFLKVRMSGEVLKLFCMEELPRDLIKMQILIH